ncbi:hypothetical protein [Bacillus bingmayongensis]|nr:hypothetical protein [Bacillus bingmayongensis]
MSDKFLNEIIEEPNQLYGDPTKEQDDVRTNKDNA